MIGDLIRYGNATTKPNLVAKGNRFRTFSSEALFGSCDEHDRDRNQTFWFHDGFHAAE